MTAEGYGTSIVVEPPITPIYDVGYLFSTQKVRKELKVTNRGQRHHQLLWTSTRTTRNISKPSPQSLTSEHLVSHPLEHQHLWLLEQVAKCTARVVDGLLFLSNRSYLEKEGLDMMGYFWRLLEDTLCSGGGLQYGETCFQEIVEFVESGVCSIQTISTPVSPSPQTVREEFFCFAIIEYVGKKQCILTSRVVAHFIEPLVITSKPQLNFRIDVQSEKDFPRKEDVEMNNLSELPLTIDFQSDFPFLIVDKEGQLATKCIKHLDRKSSTIVTVSFDPSYTTGLYSRLTLGYLHYQYKEHPQTSGAELSEMVQCGVKQTRVMTLQTGSLAVRHEADQSDDSADREFSSAA
ncbi:unnamed protein product [Timema podura]|uniref:Uncharacterized protein n=1 Tax=Timema podura TaxID=61482 RepID=A0ABN7NTZ8_TIMPD|nr:unnamed protein product [Timema podura]